MLLPSSRKPSFLHQHCNPPPPLVDDYTFQFHSHDTRTLAQHLILIIQSYCDDDTRYTAALLLHQLITQVQWSLDRAGDFSLITKLGRKHKTCSVAIINHPQDALTPSFDSTAWSYDHAPPIHVPSPPIHSQQHNLTMTSRTASHQPQHIPPHQPLITPNSVATAPFNKAISLVFTAHSRGVSLRPH